MSNTLLIPLLGASMLAPTLVCLVVLVVINYSESSRVIVYVVGVILWLSSVVISVGLNLYAYSLHPDWWAESHHRAMIILDAIAVVFALCLGWAVTAKLLPDDE